MYIGGLYERRQQGIRTEHVFYVVGRDRVVAQLSRVERRLPFFPRTENMVYLHADHLGSIETVTDSAGAVLGHRKYDPFGNQVDLQRPVLRTAPPPSPLAGVRLGFTEHEEDVDLGLINMVGRVYDPKVGRFLTPDPITTDPSGQGLNGYSYVRNNPLTFVDPLGLQAAPLDAPPGSSPTAEGGWEWTHTYYNPSGDWTQVTITYTPSPLDYRPGAFDDAGFTSSVLTSPAPPPSLSQAQGYDPVSRMGVQNLGIFGYGMAGPGTIGVPAAITVGLPATFMLIAGGAAVIPEAGAAALTGLAARPGLIVAAQNLALGEAGVVGSVVAVGGLPGIRTVAPGVDQVLFQLRNAAVALTQKLGTTTPQQFGSVADAIFKSLVKHAVQAGRLPATIRTSPASLNQPGTPGIDVWDAATGVGWDLMTATGRSVISHEAKYLRNAAPDGTIINVVRPLVYRR